MCEIVVVVSGSMNSAIEWQPMPASARLPSITRVERLCGQPEQKPGIRTGPGAAGTADGCAAA